MHDNLRLQRLVQELANKVKKLTDRQEENCADTEPHDSHQEIMALAAATFREMSLQVNTNVLIPCSCEACTNQCKTIGACVLSAFVTQYSFVLLISR